MSSDPNRADPVPQPQPARRSHAPGVTRELREEERFDLDGLPEPASYGAVLVALANMDPLAQEVMLAQRLATLPSQSDGGVPVNIPRMVRGPWAHHLRKLGIFCIPELATHELVATGDGIMVNHTAMSMRRLTTEDMWDIAKAHNPDLARLVEGAKTPEEKREAMRVLAAKLPVEQRLAMEKLSQMSRDNEDQ